MNNIIWTSEELKEIKKTLLNNRNLTFNENNELIQKLDYRKVSREELSQEQIMILEKLIHTQDRNKIKEVLYMASNIKVDPENKLHYGLITTLSKINVDKDIEIFNIYKDFVGLYNQVIDRFAKRILDSIGNSDIMDLKIKEIKNSKEVTIEEMLIQLEINEILNYTNGVSEHELFKELIDTLNNSIKNTFIKKCTTYLTTIKRREYLKTQSVSIEYMYDKKAKDFRKKTYKNKRGTKKI